MALYLSTSIFSITIQMAILAPSPPPTPPPAKKKEKEKTASKNHMPKCQKLKQPAKNGH